MSITSTNTGLVTHITLNRPDKRNAFDDTIIEALIEAFQRAGDEESTRVILLDAAGKHFSAGADLNWMRAMGELDADQNRADARRLAALMSAIDGAAKPVIARVQGAAFGGALGLICAADIAVAADDARFCLSEVKLGILPAVIAPYVVRAMGPRQARRYFMTAEVIDAPRAGQLGLVHEVVPAVDLDTTVERLIAALLNGAPGAQQRARELVHRADGSAVDPAVVDYTADLIAELRTGAEGQEGLSAFLEKRAPNWIDE
ncbi:enoyl-CoA hydratase-related protein [Alloalcanivorax marinus]|uniref:enoyl-CoA hydratase-related protein n=1 Tax=Alloalcanivorax marinus TaxID=1177169 RepID=UPI001931ACB3|nr:enoyl-CoA hydratase-related protein [Alloalcanivorax marinus]MBL7249711.1 enoyl-CoA hydratase/isomerase family protein [Alloalcanivorax marinus]